MEDRTKKIIAGVCTLASIISLGYGGYEVWASVEPDMPETVEDVESLLDSHRYQRMTATEKRPYQERINEMWGQLSKEDRERLRTFLDENPDAQQEAQDSMQQMMRGMYVNMIVKQSEQVRDMNMDNFINMSEQNGGRERMQEQANREKTEEEKEREAEGRKRMWKMLDEGDPQTIGYMSEFMKLMQERREERGIGRF